MDEKQVWRHTLATIAYRACKAMRGAPAGFETFSAGPGSRTAGQILAHLGDLFEWSTRMADGDQSFRPAQPVEWHAGVTRFFAALESFDRRVADEKPTAISMRRLFQGPISDALTHIGQISLLRRLAGSPIRGEVYPLAKIEIGRVGIDQAEPVQEFD
jgi:hypothetical protein